MVFPGLGSFIAILIMIGGLAFNIGNIAGGGLGMNVMFGVSVEIGAVITAVLAIIIFLLKDAGKVMDMVVVILGLVMIGMVGYVMLTTNPPIEEALTRTFFPEKFQTLILPVITLVGGKVGGYITFAGGHRLI